MENLNTTLPPSLSRELTPTIANRVEALPSDAQFAFISRYKQKSKSTATAYLAWLFLGWHYLYLGKIGTQIAFWLTAGGLGIWWVIDLLRIPSLIRTHNDDIAHETLSLIKTIHT